jgi:hypothetical protein
MSAPRLVTRTAALTEVQDETRGLSEQGIIAEVREAPVENTSKTSKTALQRSEHI